MTAVRPRAGGRTTALAVLGVAAVSALVAVAPASAHKPRFLTPGRPLAIGDGTVSYAAYGRLGCPGDTVELRATLARGATLHAELLIPAEGPEAARAATDLPRLTVIDPTG